MSLCWILEDEELEQVEIASVKVFLSSSKHAFYFGIVAADSDPPLGEARVQILGRHKKPW